MVILDNEEQKIAKILVEKAQQHKVVTFKEIMQKVGIGRRYLGKYLENIGKKCIELDLPVITVLVVYSATGRVGKGYKIFEPDFERNPILIKTNQNQVWYNKNLSKLL